MTEVNRCQPLLGTYVTISLLDPEGKIERPLFLEYSTKAFEEIRTIHNLMSFHEPESELSRINRNASLHPVVVNPRTFSVIEMSLQLSEATAGVFDISIAPQMVSAGLLPFPEGAPESSKNGNWKNIQLNKADSTIFFDKPLWLDLGGIAKGFAVDRAIEVLKELGTPKACINAGGDIRWLGEPDANIGIKHPLKQFESTVDIPTKGPALATSAFYYMEDEKCSHIIHPVHGPMVPEEKSVTVFANTCMEADALTKVICLAKGEEDYKVLKSCQASAAIIDSDGEVKFLE